MVLPRRGLKADFQIVPQGSTHTGGRGLMGYMKLLRLIKELRLIMYVLLLHQKRINADISRAGKSRRTLNRYVKLVCEVELSLIDRWLLLRRRQVGFSGTLGVHGHWVTESVGQGWSMRRWADRRWTAEVMEGLMIDNLCMAIPL